MQLNELQSLPFKWWKKGKLYIPQHEDIEVEMKNVYKEPFSIDIHDKLVKTNITALTNLQHINNIVPTKYDFMLAINTELLEYEEERNRHFRSMDNPYLNIRLEIADIAIFCALFLKTYYNEDLYKLVYSRHSLRHEVEIEPVYTWYPDCKERIIQLLMWAITSTDQIPYKLKHNKERADHGNPRY